MENSKRTLMPLLVILMLVLQLMSPIAVLADGETPPDPPTTEDVPLPEEPTETEEISVEEVSPTEEEEVAEEPAPEDASSGEEGEITEEAPAEEVGPSDEPADTDPASEPNEEPAPQSEAEDLSVAEVLEQAPAETEIVVVNDEGQIEPLVTEAAAAIAAEADPIWCPNGVTPQDGLNGCSPSFTYSNSSQPLTELIAWLQTNDPDADGTIWIEKNYDSAAESVDAFVLNGSGFTNFNTHTLTIQGGWNGLGTTTVDGSNPSTFTGDRIRIANWGNDVTINNILITGASGQGLAVITTGDINLNNVTSQNNTARGAHLNNSGKSGNGNVAVQNSSFSNNADTGLRVNSNGNITLANVTADQNNWRGVALDNYSGDGTVSVNSSTFSNNDRIGLYIDSYSDVTLNNVISTGNGRDGAEIYGANINIQSSQFNGNDGFGIRAGDFFFGIPSSPELSNTASRQYPPLPLLGSITLNQVTANSNGLEGAVLSSIGDIIVSNSQFNNNDGSGLVAGNFWFGISTGPELSNAIPRQYPPLPLSGNITLSQVTANSNGWMGAVLLSTGDIKVFRSQFNGNDGAGIAAGNFLFGVGSPQLPNAEPRQYPPLPFSGNITLNKVTANSNGLEGAFLEAFGNINVSNSQFNSNGADAVPFCSGGVCEYDPWFSGGIGLAAASWFGTGQIRLDNVQASHNYGDGAWLIGDDVIVRSSGFHNNGLGQAYLSGDTLWADGLYIEHIFSSSAYLECVRATNNAAYGIEIITGDITLNGVKASGNGWDDFYLESDSLNSWDDPCRGPKIIPDLPWQIVPVTGSESIELNCSAYAGTVLVLPNGDEIRLPCPTIGDASLNSVQDSNLPGSLPGENSFVSSFTAQVIQDGVNLGTLPAPMVVSFVIPEDLQDTDLAILYWNGSEWVEVAGAYKTADGRFEASVNFTGTFILVSK